MPHRYRSSEESTDRKYHHRWAAVLLLLTSSGSRAQEYYTPPIPAAVAETVAIQIALEHQGYSPGLIDGIIGSKTRIALAALQSASDLPVTGEMNDATREILEPDSGKAFAPVRISTEDLAEVDPPPRDWLGRSRKRRLLYPSLANLVAERTHTTERFLASLNPYLDLALLRPGDVLLAPAVKESRHFPGLLTRMEIDLERKMILLFGENGSRPAGILFCSTAANPAHASVGKTQVATVVADPTYTFDPKMWPEVQSIKKRLLIPPGPRSPVGLRWIGLDFKGVGIHGAPEPEKIGKTGSHGCIRLTNWDAIWLASLVRLGTPVRIVRSTWESSWKWRG